MVLDAPHEKPVRSRPARDASRRARPVVVVGGGTAGALAVLHLRRCGVERILLVDPAPPGGGVAYATADDHHRLNVRAAQMSALPDEPDDFLRWLRSTGADVSPLDFVPRRRFGEYLVDRLNRAGRPEQLRDRVCTLTPTSSGVELTTASGRRLLAASVVLALGAPPARLPHCAPELLAGARTVRDPWEPGVLNRLVEDCRNRPDTRVLLLGTGLTMADVALTLARAVPSLRLQATSRHGLFPRAHRELPSAVGPAPELPEGPLGLDAVRTLVAASVGDAVRSTGDWRPGVDRLRPVTDRLWRGLSPQEQREACRTDLRHWDVLRHRVAPSVGRTLRSLVDEGRLQVHPLHRTHGGFDVAVNCTGFGLRCTDEPLVADLVARGLARVHPLGLGLVVDDAGRPTLPSGRPLADVTVLGALRRGSFWETTAVPELRRQSVETARAVAASLDRRAQPVAS